MGKYRLDQLLVLRVNPDNNSSHLDRDLKDLAYHREVAKLVYLELDTIGRLSIIVMRRSDI